ncbi:hypothetical protein BH24ACI3_BH24ACI3_10890 [soil metagenome]
MKECQLCKNCYSDDVGTCPKDGMPTMHTIAGEPVLEGKYHLVCRLGQGGMGVVYKARHAYLKTQLAIKIILPDLVGNDPQLVTRFRQEALAAAAIRHQNVVAVTDYGVIGGSIPFLVMEYVDGEALHDLLAREKVLSPERAFDLMSAICGGVGAAHHQGIVHRDLKPLNIMICSGKNSISEAVKILDFGLAKIKSGELLGSFIQAQTTGLMGSPYYMAPEQWADDDPDSRSDIYSLGVMLYQMLAGDVPFKGSSIPAIMKKHISDPAPPFSQFGVTIAPEIERAVLHTLEKEKNRRTASVEEMINELRDAIRPSSIGIQTTSDGAFPVSLLNIKTNPPRSTVFVDNVAVGESRDDGWITLNGIQSGNHKVRVSKDGFEDWYSDVQCDGSAKQIVAELSSHADAIPKPPAATIAFSGLSPNTPQNFSATQEAELEGHKTSIQNWSTGEQSVSSDPGGTKKKFLSPMVLGAAGLLLLFIFGGVGIGAAFLMGLIPGTSAGDAPPVTNKPTPAAEDDIPPATKPDLVQIPAGSFTMGRNDGGDIEKPEHEAKVNGFWMDRTEVTNAEFYEFLQATKYRPINEDYYLAHWVNDMPIKGDEKKPVRFVSIADIRSFADWRSKRDGLIYRLPTEIEWEYAARNGEKQNLYPWGDKFENRCAVVNEKTIDPMEVASRSCPNAWGVQDLIGNVVEWTSSEAWLYPGSEGELLPVDEPRFMIRGGGAAYESTGKDAITSTYRLYSPQSMRHPALGFRLVRE